MRTSRAVLTGLLVAAIPATTAGAVIYPIPQDQAAAQSRTVLASSLASIAPNAKIATHDFVGGAIAVPTGLRLTSVPSKFTAAVVTCATAPCRVGFNRKLVLVRPDGSKTVRFKVELRTLLAGQSYRVIFSIPAELKRSIGRSTAALAVTSMRVRTLGGTLLDAQTSTIRLK
jgi:hypothetical protein